MQVASNGFISFGQPFFAYIPHSFPVQEMIVAPYWDDIDLSQKGVVLYSLINDTVSDLVDQVNDYISSKYTNFQAKWILVARWVNVCPYMDATCTTVSPAIKIFIMMCYD